MRCSAQVAVCLFTPRASGSAAMTGEKNGPTAEKINDQRKDFPEVFPGNFFVLSESISF